MIKTWCLPPKADAELVYRMEAILQVDQRPYDPQGPVIGMDEASKPLLSAVAIPLPTQPRQVKRVDYEYARQGVCHLFVLCEPLPGWRHVNRTQRRTKRDWALGIRELLEVHYPQGSRICLVLDHLNTHTGSSLYEAFPPAEARRLLDRLECHYTPKHASWLNRAESEIGGLNRPCLNRRIDSEPVMGQEVAAWEARRNEDGIKLHGTFTMAVARAKLRKLYPAIED